MDYSNRLTSHDVDRSGQPIDGPQDVLTFGQYKGTRVCDLLITDPGYLIWADKHVGFFSLSMHDALTAHRNANKARSQYLADLRKGRYDRAQTRPCFYYHQDDVDFEDSINWFEG
jgi:hypothetical protein